MKHILISIFILHIYFEYYSKSSQNEARKKESLKKALESIFDGLDRTQDPCTSYYNYACGNWLKNNEGKGDYKDETKKSILQIKKLFLDDMKSIDVNNDDTKEYAKSVRIFFDQCLNAKFDKNRETADLYKAVENIVGRIPIFEEYANAIGESDEFFNIWQLNGGLQRHLQSQFLFKISVVPTTVDCKQIPMMKIEPLDFYKVIDDEKHLEPRLNEVAKELNITFNQKELKDEIKNIIQLRKKLTRLMNKDYSSVRLKFKDLQSRVPEIPWNEFFDYVIDDNKFMQDYNKTKPDVILVGETFFHELPTVLADFKNKTVKTFAYWQVMRTSMQLFKERNEELYAGPSEGRCFDLTLKHFMPSMLRIHFDRSGINLHEWKYDIELIKEGIFSAFRYMVTGLDWLDSREKTLIMKKVRQIHFHSGIPEWIMDDDELEKTVPKFDANLSLFENDLWNEGKKLLIEMNRLLNPRKIKDPNPEFVFNAFYGNKAINLKLGFVLPSFYDLHYPLAVKYGSLGSIIGHELIHAFDSFWLLHKEDLPTGVTHLLNKDTLKLFHDKNNCLVKQYSKFCYKDLKQCVGGRKTINDNIADVNGLKIAYLAYKLASQTTRTPELPLPPSANLTDDEVFFLTSARISCGIGNVLSHIKSDDEHAPRHARVDVTMKNFPTFAKTYKCSIGKTLAPLEICSLWGDIVGTI